MATSQEPPEPPESPPALLLACLRRDLAAVQEELQGHAQGSPLPRFKGLGALHAAALADWGEGVEALLAAGLRRRVAALCRRRCLQADLPLVSLASRRALLLCPRPGRRPGG